MAGDAEEEAGEDEADQLDTSDPPGGGESTASLEDLEDEDTHSGGEGGSGGARRRGSEGGSVSKICTYEGCSETTSQVAKQRKPWMCKKHRNKMYKDKYKKKKSDQALNCGGPTSSGSAGSVKLEVVLQFVGVLGGGGWRNTFANLMSGPAHLFSKGPGCPGGLVAELGGRACPPSEKFIGTCIKP
jgi:hypothetical protein